ncbi:MAG: hypothetical protein ACE5IA_02345 [Dehalococcoidia bacterium]
MSTDTPGGDGQPLKLQLALGPTGAIFQLGEERLVLSAEQTCEVALQLQFWLLKYLVEKAKAPHLYVPGPPPLQ